MSSEDVQRRPNLVWLTVRSLVFLVIVPGSVFVLFPALVLRSSEAGWNVIPGAFLAVGVTLIVVGGGVMLLCGADFVLAGWGTAAPYDPPRRLVRGLLYTRIRNPMYAGGAAILLGEALAFRSPALLAYAVLGWFLFHLAVVFVEEPGLRRRFGKDYEAYVRSVPRWIPRRRRPPVEPRSDLRG